MAKCLITDTTLTNISNAVRNKAQIADKMTPDAVLAAMQKIANGVEVQHGVSSYESANENIPAGSFVEFTIKDTDEVIAILKNDGYFTWEQVTTSVSGCIYYRTVWDIVKVDENLWLAAVSEGYNDSSTYIPRSNYVYMVTLSIMGGQPTVIAKSSTVSVYNMMDGSFVRYGNNYYFIVFAASITSSTDNWTDATRTLYIHNIATTIGSGTVSCTISRHSLGSVNVALGSRSYDMPSVSQDGYLCIRWNLRTSDNSTYYDGNVIFKLDTTSTTNYYITRTSTSSVVTPYVSLGNNKIIGYSETYGTSVFSFSSSGYTFVEYDSSGVTPLNMPYDSSASWAYAYSNSLLTIKDITLASSFSSAETLYTIAPRTYYSSAYYVEGNELWVRGQSGQATPYIWVYDLSNGRCLYAFANSRSLGNFKGAWVGGESIGLYFVDTSSFVQKDCVKLAETRVDGLTKTEVGVNTPGEVYLNKGTGVSGITWADGTDEEIIAMIAAHYAGELNIYDYWHVGDERVVKINAMQEIDGVVTHPTQEVTLVLMNKGGKTLEDGSECLFVVGQKMCLLNEGAMNLRANQGKNWANCNRRTWCNEVYYNALPETLRTIFKKHKNITAEAYNSTTLNETWDYFALPAIKEVTSTSTGNTTEYNTLAGPWEWYASRTTNYYNKQLQWWFRSMNDSYSYCVAGYNGSSSPTYSTTDININGIAPFGCI